MTCSLYIHIPFCSSTCDYCNFYSEAYSCKDPRLDLYVERILEESLLLLQRYSVRSVPTVFIGGGTPSFLGAVRITRLMNGLMKILSDMAISMPNECSMEANPESLSEAVLHACMEGGINRLSMGIQSLHDPSRRAVGRQGSAVSARKALLLAARCFSGRLSADLISGLPLQTKEHIREDIAFIADTGIQHVSLYALSVEAGTPLDEKICKGIVQLPDEDRADSLWLSGRDYLEQKGFSQYEVSNFSYAGEECQHNLRYWNMQSWLACGPAASATIVDDSREGQAEALRFMYPSDINSFLEGSRLLQYEHLDRKTLITESLLMGFRCSCGPDPELFKKRFGLSIHDCIPRSLKKAAERKLLRTDRIALNADGLLYLNPFLVDCMNEIEQGFC